jgi:hypothetical protein
MGEFELMDCEWGSVFEYPHIERGKLLEVMYLNSFEVLNFSRIVWYSGRGYRGGCSFFGDKDYKEWEFLGNYSYKGKVGGSIKIMGIQVERRSNFTGSVDVGVGYSLISRVSLSVGLHNFYSLPTEISPPSRIGIKICYKDEKGNSSWVEVFKEKFYPYEVRIGNKLQLHNLLHLWVRLKTYPQQISVGLVICFSKWKFRYIARTHPYLGLSSLIGVEFFC